MNNNTNKFDTCFTIAMQKILKGEGDVFFQGEHQHHNQYLGYDSPGNGNESNILEYTTHSHFRTRFPINAMNLSQKYRMVTKEDF